MTPIEHPQPYSTWKHTRTGSTYTVIGTALCSTNNRQPEESVVYVSHDYQELRYRELSEFMDGRFVRLRNLEAPAKGGGVVSISK